jgi:hypothetical protein
MERDPYLDTIPSPPLEKEEESPESDRLPVERVFIPRRGDDGND